MSREPARGGCRRTTVPGDGRSPWGQAAPRGLLAAASLGGNVDIHVHKKTRGCGWDRPAPSTEIRGSGLTNPLGKSNPKATIARLCQRSTVWKTKRISSRKEDIASVTRERNLSICHGLTNVLYREYLKPEDLMIGSKNLENWASNYIRGVRALPGDLQLWWALQRPSALLKCLQCLVLLRPHFPHT